MGKKDQPCSSRMTLRPRSDPIKEEIVSSDSEVEELYIPPIKTRSGRVLARGEQKVPDSQASTASHSSTPLANVRTKRQCKKSEEETPSPCSEPRRSTRIRNNTSIQEPPNKRSKTNPEVPLSKDIKLEEPDDYEDAQERQELPQRVLRPRKKPEEEVVKEQDPENDNPNTSPESVTLIAPKKMRAESSKGVHPLDYRDRITANIRVYKAMTLDNEQNHSGHVYLNRNLFYIKAYKHQVIPNYYLGEVEPPLVWPHEPKAPVKTRSLEEKKFRILNIINILPNLRDLQKTVPAAHGIKGWKFNAEVIALATLKGKVAMTNDMNYRHFLKKSGRIVPKFFPITYPFVKMELQEKIDLSPNKENSKDNATKTPPKISKFYYSAIFRSVKHNYIHGKRIAEIAVYLVEQVDDVYYRPKRVPGALFKMDVNAPPNTIYIDLPRRELRKNLVVHLLLKVELSENQNQCSVEGHSLRNVGSRSLRSPPEELRSSPRKPTTPPSPKPIVWEQTFFSTAVVYKDPSIRGLIGYIQGDVFTTLVDKDDIGTSYTAPDFIPMLTDASRKLHSNPFVHLSIGKFNIDDIVDEDMLQKPVVTPPKKAPEPPEVPLIMENGLDGFPGIQSNLDIYTGKFKWDAQGQYVNDKEMLKHLFKQNVFKDKKKIATIRKMLPMIIPKKIVYRIMCNAELKPNFTPKVDPKYPTLLPRAKDYDLKPASLMQSESPDSCIICKRAFKNMFNLMMHYHTNYPRLAFIFQLTEETIKKCEETEDVYIDVMLDPTFSDAPEAGVEQFPVRKRGNTAFYLTTRCQSRALRQFMRMDLTLFTQFLKLPEVVDDSTVTKSRFVDTHSGRMMNVGEDTHTDPKVIPQPSFNYLVKKMNETILDYIDIDEVTKRYMCTWNKLTLSIGRCNQNKAGMYMTHRLFIEIFGERLRECNQVPHFSAQLIDELEKGAITPCEQYDLFMHLKNRDYNPIFDPKTTMYGELLDYAQLQYRKYCQAMATCKKPTMQLTVRRNFNKHFHNDPSKLNQQKLKELLLWVFLNTEVIPKTDTRRLFAAHPYDQIFDGNVNEIFDEMTPIW